MLALNTTALKRLANQQSEYTTLATEILELKHYLLEQSRLLTISSKRLKRSGQFSEAKTFWLIPRIV
jgi:hypothetical protein